MSSIYPVDKMDLPELELLFEVLQEIRKKYRTRGNRSIILGILPKFENVPHNDLIHIIGNLNKIGVVKRHDVIGAVFGLTITITNAFDPFHDWVKAEIKLRKIELEESNEQEQENDEPLIYKSFDAKKSILTIGGYDIQIAKIIINNKEHEIMKFIFIENVDDLSREFDYAEFAELLTGHTYNPKMKSAHAPFSSACDRINVKIKDATNGVICDFLVPNYSNSGFVTINQKYLK